MGLDAHVAFLEAGEHIISGRHGALLRDGGLVVEPLGVAFWKFVEQVYGRSAAVPVAVIHLVLGGEAERTREGSAIRIECGNPVELGARRLCGVSPDVHPDIPGLRHLESADLIGSGGCYADLAVGTVAGKGEFVGFRSGWLRSLERQVQAPGSFRAEKQRQDGGRVIPGQEAAVVGVDHPGRILIEGTAGFRDEDISPEGDDDGIRSGLERGGGGITAGCGENEDRQQRFE